MPELDALKILPLSLGKDTLIGQIGCLKDNKVHLIGLGESMHGNKAFEAGKTQIIKWLAMHRDCKLVMMEMPGMLVLKWSLSFPIINLNSYILNFNS